MVNDKIIGVIRTSTERQETESQKTDLTHYIERLGFSRNNIVWVEVQASSTKKNEKYDRFIDEIKSICLSGVKNVAVWHLNRFGRDERVLNQLKWFFEDNQVQMYCQEPSLTLLNEKGERDHASDLMIGTFFSLIKSETQEREEKLLRGKKYAQKSGRYIGGKVLYGYMLSADKHFIINPEESAIVNEIFDLYETGEYSCQKIADRLNLRGIMHRSVTFKAPEIHRILTCTHYLGTESNNIYPQIIDKERFNNIKTILRENQTIISKESQNCNYGIGLIRCSECGRRYVADSKQYICIRRKAPKRFDGIPCKTPTLRIKLLDEILWLTAYYRHISMLLSGNDERIDVKQKEIDELKANNDNIKAEIKNVEKRRQKAANDYYVAGSLPENVYNNVIAQISVTEERLNADYQLNINKIDMLEKQKKLLSAPFARKYVNAVKILDKLDYRKKDREQCREIIQSHILAIETEYVDVDGKQMTLITVVCSVGKPVKVIYKFKNNTAVDYTAAWIYIEQTGDYAEWLTVSPDKTWIFDPYVTSLVLDENAGKVINDVLKF